MNRDDATDAARRDDLRAWLLDAQQLERLGRLPEAAAAYERLLNPRYVPALLNLAILETDLGRRDEATTPTSASSRSTPNARTRSPATRR